MKVGDRIGHMCPTYGDSHGDADKKYPGVVVYIHPQRRYYTVEFDMGNGMRCRESFYFKFRNGETRRKS